MTAKPGSYTLDPSSGSVVLRTGREGMASKVGHDLVIDAGRWNANVTIDGDPSKSEVNATIDVRGLEVREGVGGAKPLSDKDKRDIKKNIGESLKASQFPEITFRSQTVESTGDTQVKVNGELTVAGSSRPVSFPLSIEEDGSSVRLRGKVPIVQSNFGIKPFSAMMGALKVKDQVEVEIDVRIPAA